MTMLFMIFHHTFSDAIKVHRTALYRRRNAARTRQTGSGMRHHITSSKESFDVIAFASAQE